MVEPISRGYSQMPDPLNDRFVKTVECPPNKALEKNKLYPYQGKNYYTLLLKLFCVLKLV